MSLKGNFGTFYIATILQLLGDDRKTGILRVTKEDKEVQVFLQNGIIIYAKGSHTRDQLGKLLRTNGNITDDQFQECLDISRQNNQAIGKVLVEKGYITMDMLKRNLCKQAENLIFDLFLWENGNFEYRDADIDLKGLKIVQINTMQIILEATRRIDEMPLLKKQIPDESIVFCVVPTESANPDVKLNETEWRMLAFVDGRRTVRRIIQDSGYDRFLTYQVLNSLSVSGRIRICESAVPAADTETALAEITRLDSKTLRRLLDRVGLARSSTIRMALNRLLRNAASKAELNAAILAESSKISSDEEIRTLREIWNGSQIPELHHTISLLMDQLKKQLPTDV